MIKYHIWRKWGSVFKGSMGSRWGKTGTVFLGLELENPTNSPLQLEEDGGRERRRVGGKING